MLEQDLITGVRFLGAASMIIVALVVALANRGRVRSIVYEHSRWCICIASMLLGIHNVIQFYGHFREQSTTLCWTINMAFFVIITPLYNMGELNLLRAGHCMKNRLIHNIGFIAVCYAIFAVGFATDTLVNDQAPWLTATFAVAVCFFVKLIELSVTLHREMKIADHTLNDDELEERHDALMFTAKSMKWIIFISFVTPWMGMSSSLFLHSALGLLIMGLLFWFNVQFVLYGVNMSELIEVSDEITEAQMIASETQAEASLMAESTSIAQRNIEQWVSERHYTNPNLTISIALDEMGISATALNYYLENNTTVGSYRAWLPYLRLEEAKRIMTQHPEYSLQAVAEACGYANKSSLSHAFKAHEGMTPLEWIKKSAN